MTQSPFTVSETEAAERLEELVDLAKLGLDITIVADSGERYTLRPIRKEATKRQDAGRPKTEQRTT